MADYPIWCSSGPLSYLIPPCYGYDVPTSCRLFGVAGRVFCKRNGYIKGDDPLTTIADKALNVGENVVSIAEHLDYIIYGGLVIGGAFVLSTLIRELR